MRTIQKNVSTQIVEKKSKFIANLFYISSEEEAKKKLEEVRKKYYDAKHHCFAYRVVNQNKIIEKASDNGEPAGTAGAPILNLLTKLELTNVLLIVTRYFGGILLGTGGLVRAYTQVSQFAIENTKIVEISKRI